ncbi:hypothetical protein [Fructilactobacillus cliffordii]|uniref:Phage abortive infection protein n=1 Tax=Fructilactobacillus cliffordii TaxID=2940299 RepID=A0A9Q8ZXC6_9LACO|nr:hypothetical protein [Fructilactobacillus cliffordii]USS86182.1 hypothetical protein M3M38_05670 [Fructilactobacillus cliffordii]USS89251.1 hypothetical protein M3M40_00095 [Fructilactobacillus cliffordii]
MEKQDKKSIVEKSLNYWNGLSDIGKIFLALFLVNFPLIVIFLYIHGLHYFFNDKLGFKFGNGTTDGWLGMIGAYFGAIIAIGGIYWQVTIQNREQTKSLEKQLSVERKNSFDSSIAVENYKNYISLANKISNLCGELIYLKQHLKTKKSSSDIKRYNDWDNYFEGTIIKIIASFDDVNKFYSFKGKSINKNIILKYEKDFFDLLTKIKKDRSIIENIFVDIDRMEEYENPEEIIDREVSNLEKLENLIIHTAVDLIK